MISRRVAASSPVESEHDSVRAASYNRHRRVPSRVISGDLAASRERHRRVRLSQRISGISGQSRGNSRGLAAPPSAAAGRGRSRRRRVRRTAPSREGRAEAAAAAARGPKTRSWPTSRPWRRWGGVGSRLSGGTASSPQQDWQSRRGGAGSRGEAGREERGCLCEAGSSGGSTSQPTPR